MVISLCSAFSKLNYIVLLSNQTARFFDHQYFWNKTNPFFDIMLRDSYWGKIASKTTNIALLWQDMSSLAWTCLHLSVGDIGGDIGWSGGSIAPFKVAQNLKGHWTNLTVFWKLANNVLYAKIRRLFNIKKLFEWTKILFF